MSVFHQRPPAGLRKETTALTAKKQKPDSGSAAPVPALAPPDGHEQHAIERARRRVDERRPRVRVDLDQPKEGRLDIRGGGHSDHDGWLIRLQDAFGTNGTSFALSQLNQLIGACRENGKIDTARMNAMLAMIEAAKPEDELQAALAVQMAPVHYATTVVINRAMKVDQIHQFDSAAGMAVKFARAFAMQAEALAKLQRKGEQIVKVVHVHSGGQAIVGNVSAPGIPADAPDGTRGGVREEIKGQPHAKALPPAKAAPELSPLWRRDEERAPVPLACGAD